MRDTHEIQIKLYWACQSGTWISQPSSLSLIYLALNFSFRKSRHFRCRHHLQPQTIWFLHRNQNRKRPLSPKKGSRSLTSVPGFYCKNERHSLLFQWERGKCFSFFMFWICKQRLYVFEFNTFNPKFSLLRLQNHTLHPKTALNHSHLV